MRPGCIEYDLQETNVTISEMGSIGELVGALLVLVTLVYLSVQLRATNDIAKADGHRDLIKQLNEWYGEMGDANLMALLLEGSESFDKLSGADQLRFDAFVHRYFHICEQAWYMGRDRYIPAGSYDAFMDAAVAMSSHGAQVWWKNAQPTFAKDFVAMIDERRSTGPDVPPLKDFLPAYMYIYKSRSDA